MDTVALQPSNADGGSNVQTAPHSALLLSAQLRRGGVVSTTVTDWLQVLRLQPSVAIHVRVAKKVPSQNPLWFVTVLTI
jgi:hypothetical protein